VDIQRLNSRRRAPPTPKRKVGWILAVALLVLTPVACDVHSPVGPGDVATLTLTPGTTTLAINGSQQLIATARDAEGRVIGISGPGSDASFVWDLVNGGGAVSAAGVFQAGTQIGTFTNTVRVRMGGLEAHASFLVINGPAVAINVTPNPWSLAINGSQPFTATAVDAGGNPVPLTATWSVVNGGGTINATSGVFSAGATAGTFPNTVRATSGTLSGFATVTVVPGPAVALSIAPNPVTLPINGTQTFVATAVDAGGNPVPVTASWATVNGGGTIHPTSGLFTAGAVLGTYANTVRATSGNITAFATVSVAAGPAVTVTVTPSTATMGVNDTQQFNATAVDAAGNPVAINPIWSVANGGGSIHPTTGVFTASTVLGTFTNTVRATIGGVFGSATVNVVPGPATVITVIPNPVSLTANAQQTFTATAVDANGNPVAITPVWSVTNGGGTVNAATGQFTAGTVAGTFANTVRATVGAAFGSATVNVTAGAAAVISVLPNPATLATNGTQTFTATAVDANGNPVAISPTWSVTNGGGTVNAATGQFTAGTVSGTFTNTVRATSGTVFGSATVNVTAGPAAVITVIPNPGTVVVNQNRQFSATAVDANGNPVAITPVWSVENGGGTINGASGLFTAGAVAGTFNNTVRATSGTAFGSATVEVTAVAPPPPPPGIFGSAAPNGIMAGTAVTCISLGLIDADVSIHPGSTITGFPPCTITGVQNLGNALAEQMQIDLTTAYNDLAGRPCPPANAIVADLGGTTKAPGVYCTASGIGVTGILTLDGGGDPNAEFVFQAGTSLITAGNVVLINGAQAKNVYWLVGSSATLGTASQWQGNIVALTSITLVDTSTLIGRALARNGAVSLGTANTITLPPL